TPEGKRPPPRGRVLDMESAAEGTNALRARLETGRFGRPAQDAALDAEEGDARAGSILESVQRLKEQILEKDRIINQKTGALVATRDYLRGVFEALADAVLVIDDEGVIEFANLAAHELLA